MACRRTTLAVLTQSRALADYFESAVRGFPNAKVVSNWVMSELLRVLPGDDERAIGRTPVTPARLVGLLRLIDDGTISGKIAKDVFEKMRSTGEAADAIVQREGLTQVADAGALAAVVDRVLAENPKPRGGLPAREDGSGQGAGGPDHEGHAGQGQSRRS